MGEHEFPGNTSEVLNRQNALRSCARNPKKAVHRGSLSRNSWKEAFEFAFSLNKSFCSFSHTSVLALMLSILAFYLCLVTVFKQEQLSHKQSINQPIFDFKYIYFGRFHYVCVPKALVAQWSERWSYEPNVDGSNPPWSIPFLMHHRKVQPTFPALMINAFKASTKWAAYHLRYLLRLMNG